MGNKTIKLRHARTKLLNRRMILPQVKRATTSEIIHNSCSSGLVDGNEITYTLDFVSVIEVCLQSINLCDPDYFEVSDNFRRGIEAKNIKRVMTRAARKREKEKEELDSLAGKIRQNEQVVEDDFFEEYS